MIRRSEGQATVEAALTLPIVLIALLLIVQVGIVVRDALALAQAAREGARAASISASDENATQAVLRSAGPLAADRIDIAVAPSDGERRTGEAITVQLGYSEQLSIPVVSRIVSLRLPLHASATTQLERSDVTPTPAPQATPTPQATPVPSASASPTPGPSPTPTPSVSAPSSPTPTPRPT